MTGTIPYLKIANYRSIDVLELHDLQAFSVFAGPNGAGKTNFFEALDFVNSIIQLGVTQAIKKHGGFKNICCLMRTLETARVFEFELVLGLETDTITYHLEIHQLDTSPILEEYILDGGKKWTVNDIFKDNEEGKQAFIHSGKSFLPLFPHYFHRINLFNNFRLYRIDPNEAKSPIKNYDDSELNHNGGNLVSVLTRLESNDEIRETINEWMELIVPSLEKVQIQNERLTGNTLLAFKEEGIEKAFPAHLISDGTIYLLSILVAIFDRPALGMTLIEEPERGLHPKAIIEFVDGFHEQATYEHPIWVTTHNEALVRCLKNNELWLVDKKQGKTQMKHVTIVDKLASTLDEAWLTNALDGGLPW
jgi:predicted ATPase